MRERLADVLLAPLAEAARPGTIAEALALLVFMAGLLTVGLAIGG